MAGLAVVTWSAQCLHSKRRETDPLGCQSLMADSQPVLDWRCKVHKGGLRCFCHLIKYAISSGSSRYDDRRSSFRRLLWFRRYYEQGDALRSKRLVLSLFVLCFAGSLCAQPWSGIISPTRAVNWSNAGIPGGIPSGSWAQCGSTIAAFGTSAAPASPAPINIALLTCPANQYVLLGSGDFYLNGGINFAGQAWPYGQPALTVGYVIISGGYIQEVTTAGTPGTSPPAFKTTVGATTTDSTVVWTNMGAPVSGYGNNIVLRGAGANQARLHFTSVSSCNGWAAAICLAGGNTYEGGGYYSANWTGGLSQGTTQITLDNVTGITLNLTPIVLDQCNTGFTGMSGSPTCTGTASDNSNLFICDTEGVCSSQTGNSGLYRPNRAQEEVVVATAITGSGPYTVTISPGIRNPNWSSGLTPEAWWPGTVITNSGVENLLVDESTVGARSITMMTSYKCWVKGIASTTANYYHVENFLSSHNVVRDSYIYWSYNSATQSYGIGGLVSADLLFENNISQGVTDAIAFDASCAGCVASYNFVVNPYYSPSIAYMFPAVAFHSAGESMILVEGNIGPQVDSDDIHGTHDMNTFFRNFFTGFEPNNGTQTNKNTDAIHVAAMSRYMNMVGNVIGTAGYDKNYQCLAPTSPLTGVVCSNQGVTPYDIGFSSNTHGQSDYNSDSPDDPKAGTTLLRWGNYDTVTGAVRWCGNSSDTGWSTICGSTSEVPTGDAYFPNSVPTLGDTGAGQVGLPASFYYSSKPSWVPSTTSWPIIGPDVSSGSISICTSGTYVNSLILNGSQCAGGTYSAVMGGHAQPNPAMQCYFNTMNGTPNGTGGMLSFNATTCYVQSTGATPLAAPTNVTATAH